MKSSSTSKISVDSNEIQTMYAFFSTKCSLSLLVYYIRFYRASRSDAWWSAVRTADKASVERLITASDGNILLTRGVVGETALYV